MATIGGACLGAVIGASAIGLNVVTALGLFVGAVVGFLFGAVAGLSGLLVWWIARRVRSILVRTVFTGVFAGAVSWPLASLLLALSEWEQNRLVVALVAAASGMGAALAVALSSIVQEKASASLLGKS